MVLNVKSLFWMEKFEFHNSCPPPRTFPPPGKFPRYATTSLPTLFSRLGGKSPIFTWTTLPRTIFKGWEDKSIIFARIWASLLYFQRGGGKSTILTQIQPFLEFLLKEGRIRVPYFFYIKTSLHTIFLTTCLIIKKKNKVFQISLLLGWKGGGGSIWLAIVQMLSSSLWLTIKVGPLLWVSGVFEGGRG